jgi:Rrf2 family protein
MSILFSRQCEYALQAIFLLARQENGSMMSIRELTDRLKIPYHFLAKILQDLTRKGILKSHRGPTGGFSLAKSPSEITLYQVIETIDGSGIMEDCVLGFPECTSDNPCAFHEKWHTMRESLQKLISTEHLDRIIPKMKKPEYQEM